MDLKKWIRTIPDFPQEGILFRDITTLLKDPKGLQEAVRQLQEGTKDMEYDVIVGPESRGFIFGVPLAYAQGKGFIPVRKPGKLPAEVFSQDYELEYGVSKLEMHQDAILPGQKVLIVDDLLATGGTAGAIAQLVRKAGGSVAGFAFLIELADLKGRKMLSEYPVCSVITY